MKRKATPTADIVFANAAVSAWYEDTLQTQIVGPMAYDMLRMLRAAWAEGGGIALAQDHIPEAAGVIFRDPRGWVLMLERADGSGWGWPGGGVEPGETPLGAAMRECAEEMNYSPHFDCQLQLINTQGGPVRYHTFLCDVERAFAPVLNHEHTDWLWQPASAWLVTRPNGVDIYPSIRSTLLTCGLLTLQEMQAPALGQDAKAIRPSTNRLLRTAFAEWGLKWNKRVTKMADEIATNFATKNKQATDRAMKKAFAKSGFTIKFKPTRAAVEAFEARVAENVGLIKSIPQKFLTDVEAVVWQGVLAGHDMREMSEQIKQKYGVAWRRASLIAKDQNNKGLAAMERARRLDNGIDKALWMHSHAGVEPRPTHVKKSGKEYDVKKGWRDPATGKYIWPGTEINCRCRDKAVIPGFE